MALLTRYMQLSSPEETHVFNFVVTKSVTRDLRCESKKFTELFKLEISQNEFVHSIQANT